MKKNNMSEELKNKLEEKCGKKHEDEQEECMTGKASAKKKLEETCGKKHKKKM